MENNLSGTVISGRCYCGATTIQVEKAPIAIAPIAAA